MPVAWRLPPATPTRAAVGCSDSSRSRSRRSASRQARSYQAPAPPSALDGPVQRVGGLGPEGDAHRDQRARALEQLPDRGRRDPVAAAAAAALDDPLRLLGLDDRGVHPDRARRQPDAEPCPGADARESIRVRWKSETKWSVKAGRGESRRSARRPARAERRSRLAALTGPMAGAILEPVGARDARAGVRENTDVGARRAALGSTWRRRPKEEPSSRAPAPVREPDDRDPARAPGRSSASMRRPALAARERRASGLPPLRGSGSAATRSSRRCRTTAGRRPSSPPPPSATARRLAERRAALLPAARPLPGAAATTRTRSSSSRSTAAGPGSAAASPPTSGSTTRASRAATRCSSPKPDQLAAGPRRPQPQRRLRQRRAGRVGQARRRRRADDRPLPPLRARILTATRFPATVARTILGVSSAQVRGALPPSSRRRSPEPAERARERLHEEIERVRVGVEEMLAEQRRRPSRRAAARAGGDARGDPRATSRSGSARARSGWSARCEQVDARTRRLEQRLDEAEQERRYAEWRIHTNTEPMLDGLLREVRAIADLLTTPLTRATSPPQSAHGTLPAIGPRHAATRSDSGRPEEAASQARLDRRPCSAVPPPSAHSVEMLGSACTLCGTTIRKLLAASAASARTRSASSSWPVARSSSA